MFPFKTSGDVHSVENRPNKTKVEMSTRRAQTHHILCLSALHPLSFQHGLACARHFELHLDGEMLHIMLFWKMVPFWFAILPLLSTSASTPILAISAQRLSKHLATDSGSLQWFLHGSNEWSFSMSM